jgi:hypothetical protein
MPKKDKSKKTKDKPVDLTEPGNIPTDVALGFLVVADSLGLDRERAKVHAETING